MSHKRISVAVSACLMGECCTYKGTHHRMDCVAELEKLCHVVKICPESQGGLSCPRLPAEIVDQGVFLQDGTDVTKQFRQGAQAACSDALAHHCRYALLKEKSPSCGFGRVYDGTFSGVLVPGNGYGAQALHDAGITIFGDTHVDELLKLLHG